MVKQSKPPAFPFDPGAARETAGFSPDSPADHGADMQLAGHFLIAMPSMHDPIFGGSVVYLCEHNPSGALGVIINKPTDMTLAVLLDRIDLKLEIVAGAAPAEPQPIMYGGPVQVERGFVLHAPRQQFSSMMKVTDDIALTTSKDVLEAVAAGGGPEQILVTLGCAGWSAGQLEEEIARNGWLTVKADPAIIFELPIAERFSAAMKLLGFDPLMLSGEAGHA